MQVQTRHSGLAAADPACSRQGMELGSSLSRAAELPLHHPYQEYPAPVASRQTQICWLTVMPRTQPLSGVLAQPSWVLLTCFTVHSEVLLPLQHTVDYPGTAPIGGVVGIRGHHLHHRGACSRDKEENRKSGRSLEEQHRPLRAEPNTDCLQMMREKRTAGCKCSITSPPNI